MTRPRYEHYARQLLRIQSTSASFSAARMGDEFIAVNTCCDKERRTWFLSLEISVTGDKRSWINPSRHVDVVMSAAHIRRCFKDLRFPAKREREETHAVPNKPSDFFASPISKKAQKHQNAAVTLRNRTSGSKTFRIASNKR